MKKVGAADGKHDVINFPRKTFQSSRQAPEIFRETTHYEASILPPTHSACCVTRNLDLTFLMRNARKWIFTTEKRLQSCCNWLRTALPSFRSTEGSCSADLCLFQACLFLSFCFRSRVLTSPPTLYSLQSISSSYARFGSQRTKFGAGSLASANY